MCAQVEENEKLYFYFCCFNVRMIGGRFDRRRPFSRPVQAGKQLEIKYKYANSSEIHLLQFSRKTGLIVTHFIFLFCFKRV